MPPTMPGWDWSDPFGLRDFSGAGWPVGSPGMTGVGAAATPYRALFAALQKRLVGREINTRVGGHDVALTVTGFDSPLDPLGLTVGQFGEVRVAARDLCWDGHRFERASALLHNAHLRPGMPTTLIAAPVDLSVTLPAAVIDEMLQQRVPRLSGAACADDTVRVHWRRRPDWGALDVGVELSGSTLWLRARALSTRGRRWGLSDRIPAYPVRLPAPPGQLVVTGASLHPDSLEITGLLPQWQVELPMTDIEDVITRLSQKTGPFNFRWPGSRSGSG